LFDKMWKASQLHAYGKAPIRHYQVVLGIDVYYYLIFKYIKSTL